MNGDDAALGEPLPPQPSGRRRRRTVTWVALGVAVAVAVLIAVLASSGPASEVSASSPLIGKPAPAVTGSSIDGSGHPSLAALRGEWVLVNFAASWCIPCREEMPQLSSFAAEGSRVRDATILTDEYDPSDVASLASLLRSSHATWPAVNDGQAVVDYGVGGLPESYLVDPQGTVVAKYVGTINAHQLESVIGQFPSAGSAG